MSDQKGVDQIDTVFAAVVAGYGEPVLCQATTRSGVGCRRSAGWRLSIHGCERVLLCGQHLAAWQQKAHATMGPYCERCARTWDALADAYTVSAL